MKLLSPHHGLSQADHRKLLGDLRDIRMECNEDMLAIGAHHKKEVRTPNSALSKESIHTLSDSTRSRVS